MALQSTIECSCHAHESGSNCSIWQDTGRLRMFNARETNDDVKNLEVDSATIEHLVTLRIQCHLCKAEALETIRELSINPRLKIPIEFRHLPHADPSLVWLLSSHPYKTRKLQAQVISNPNEIPVLLDFPSYRDDVYRFLYKQSGGGILSSELLQSSSLPKLGQENGNGSAIGDEVAKVVRNLFSKARESTLTDENLTYFVRQLDHVYDAVAVGYYFLRLFHPETMTLDLIWVLNNHRQAQADFFTQCADYLQSSGLSLKSAWSQICMKLQECFDKSLEIFDHQQVWDALRYGIRLFNPNVPDSFVYRHLTVPDFPMSMFTEFLIRSKREPSSMPDIHSFSHTARSIVEQFLPADRWDRLQQDAEAYSPFLNGASSSSSSEFLYSDSALSSFMAERLPGSALVHQQEVSSWYGLGKIPIQSLEEAAQRFWETRVSQYHQSTNGFLSSFVTTVRASQQQPVVDEAQNWTQFRLCVDAVFSVKIGLTAYGELDWILARCYEVRLCKSFRGDGLINRSLSHVISGHFLAEETIQREKDLWHSPKPVQIAKPPGLIHLSTSPVTRSTLCQEDDSTGESSLDDHDGASSVISMILPILADVPPPPPPSTKTEATSPHASTNSPPRAVRTSPIQSEFQTPTLDSPTSSLLKLQPLSNFVTTMVDDDDIGQTARRGVFKELPQMVQDWTGKTSCVVRVPAIFHSFIVESGGLHDIAEQTSAFIDVVRAGKILAANSSFRIQGKTSEIVSEAVRLLELLVINLGICERRIQVTKPCAAKIVGKGGDRIAKIRSQANCKILVVDVEPAERYRAWVIFVGLPEQVNEGYRQVRRVIENFHPRDMRIPSVHPPPTTFIQLAKTSSSEASDDDPQSLLLAKTPARSVLVKSSSDSTDADVENYTPSSTEEGKFADADKTIKIASKPDFPRPDDALFKAVQRRDWASALDLVDRNEGIAFVAASGTTLLHKAAERNAPESLINILIAKGLDANQAMLKKGFTSVHFAVQGNCRPSVLETLIKAGADVNRVDEHGSTPAHLAAARNASPKLVDLLAVAGADFSLKDKSGMTPLSIATSNGASKELLAAFKREPRLS